jgi:hypothetical protein
MAWLNTTRERWGNKFLGIYLYDELGGRQIDTGHWETGIVYTRTNSTTFANVTDCSDAAIDMSEAAAAAGACSG